MRRNPVIEAIWASGDFVGLNRADSRITVDRDWRLHDGIAPGSAMAARRQPGRWWQDAAATQVELDLPTQLIRQVSRSQQIGSDFAQLNITCWNADDDGSPNKPKQGWLSQRRGFSGPGGLRLTATGEARWPHLEPYEWSTVKSSADGRVHSYGRLAQGNIIRSYQGYGGFVSIDGRIMLKSRTQALLHGNIVPTGVWLIDEVDYDDEGNIDISCRDIGQLLGDPTIWYPPWVPTGCYPTQFYSKQFNLETTGNPRGVIPSRTNYRDLTDPVRLALIWGGWWLKGGPGTADGRWPAILGGIEDTGMASPSVIGADFFDKKPPIDVIKAIRDIVGYSTWVDQEGGFRFQSPNFWEAGNFDYDGKHHRHAWDIDEEAELLSMKVKGTKQIDRSSITVAMADPYANQPGTVKIAAFDTNTTSVKNQLHALHAPAIMGIDRDIPHKEMVTLAELTGLRMWWLRRRATIRCAANPLIDVDDQVRAWERTTFDTYLHRVESVNTTHDLDSGEYTMEMGTHWLGADNTDWVVRVGPGGHVVYNTPVSTGGTTTYRNRRDSHTAQPLVTATDADDAATVTPVWSGP